MVSGFRYTVQRQNIAMALQIHLDHHHFLSFLLALAVLQGIGALEFDVYNNAASTPGGAR